MRKRHKMDDRFKSEESALFVMEGVKGGHDGMNASAAKKFRKKTQLPLDYKQFASDVRSGNRTALAKAITLIESANSAIGTANTSATNVNTNMEKYLNDITNATTDEINEIVRKLRND